MCQQTQGGCAGLEALFSVLRSAHARIRGMGKEQPFIAGVAAAFTPSGLALLYSVVSGEYAGAAWFIWMPIVLLAVLAPAMWWLVSK